MTQSSRVPILNPVRLALPVGSLVSGESGCAARDRRQPVYPVDGSVLVNGKPAAHAVVVFHLANDADPRAPRPTGEVQADGKFELGTWSAADGGPDGDYLVTVFWQDAPTGPGADSEDRPDKLGGRYANPRTTSLRVQIRGEPNVLPPFNLKR